MRTSNITCQGQRDTETGEPDDAISIKSGSEGGWEKRPAMDLARSLPNLETKARFIAQVMTGSSTVRTAEDIGGQELSYSRFAQIWR